LGADLAAIRPLLFHATELDHLPASAPCPVVVTLHDLIPWSYRTPRLWGERARYSLGRRRLRQLSLVLAVSQSTAADAIRLGGVRPERIRVIPEAVDSIFEPRPDA